MRASSALVLSSKGRKRETGGANVEMTTRTWKRLNKVRQVLGINAEQFGYTALTKNLQSNPASTH